MPNDTVDTLTLLGGEASADETGLTGPRPPRRSRGIGGFVAWRLTTGLVTLFAASILLFVATNALPGDVAETVLGKDATPERVSALRSELDLDRPLHERYGAWLAGAVKGDLGDSAVQLAQGAPSAPVSSLIADPLMNSAALAVITATLLIPIALLLGAWAAVRANRPIDHAISNASLLLGSLPEFVLGTFLITIFFSWLGVLPPVALVPPGAKGWSDPSALVLPVLTLLGVSLAFAMRQVRAGMVHSMKQDYVMTAYLNGVSSRRVVLRYGLRNALAPSVQTFAQSIQYLFGGIILVEALFAYPGAGSLLVNAVQTRDAPLVLGLALVIAAVYIAINILADLLVVLLVPKLRTAL